MSAELHTLVGAYALDAMDNRERVGFEHHLASCPTCTAELFEFHATTARLADAVAVAPPVRLREQVLAAIRRTPQQRPVVTALPTSGWRRHSSALLVAAAVIAVVAVSGLYLGERDRNNDMQAEQTLISQVMAAEDVKTSPPGRRGVPVRVYSSDSLNQAVIAVDRLPEISDEQSYELWAVKAGEARSLGVIDDSASSGTELVDGLGQATVVAVTVEQLGGSTTGRPTSDPIETVDVT